MPHWTCFWYARAQPPCPVHVLLCPAHVLPCPVHCCSVPCVRDHARKMQCLCVQVMWLAVRIGKEIYLKTQRCAQGTPIPATPYLHTQCWYNNTMTNKRVEHKNSTRGLHTRPFFNVSLSLLVVLHGVCTHLVTNACRVLTTAATPPCRRVKICQRTPAWNSWTSSSTHK